jgi:hypothetical protein
MIILWLIGILAVVVLVLILRKKKTPLPYWFILIFAPPGNGKSLEQARLSDLVLREYLYTEKKYPDLPKRFLMTNQQLVLSDVLKQKVLYWEHPEDIRYCPRVDCWKMKDIHVNHDVDIFIDEGSTLFPADGWSLTPMWLRKMWAQHRHNGIRIVMLTQDFMAIDINCRRMLWQSYFVNKIVGSRDISPTLPALSKWTIQNFLNPLKHVVWGIYSSRRFDPLIMRNDALAMLTIQLDEKLQEDYADLKLIGGSKLHLITWRKIQLYDTTQNVKEFEPRRELEHIEALCKKPNCGYVHKTHRLK